MTLPPPVTIEMLRQRAGIPDNAQDAQLEAAFDAAFAMVERYLDRGLMLQADTQQESEFGRVILLRRWPIASVESVGWGAPAVDIPPSALRVDKAHGMIGYAGGWYSCLGPITVNWTGGFASLPPDLVYAILATFDQVWLTDPSFAGTQGGLAQGSPQKVSIVGVGSYDLGSGGAGAMGSAGSPWGMIPASAAEILDTYANHSRQGGA